MMLRRIILPFGTAALAVGALAASAAAADDYSLWADRPFGPAALVELAQRQDACCKHCTKGQPCGNTCISAKARCKSPPGCAC